MNKILILVGVVASVVLLYIVSAVFQVKVRDIDSGWGVQLIGGKRGETSIEGFESQPASLNYSMGKYSNIRIQLPNNDSIIRKHTQLLPSKLYIPQGTPLPLLPKVSKEPAYTNGTNVDGTANSPAAMSMLKYNQCRPDCCPGTYSCSGGCVCLSKKQSDFINARGNNRTAPSNY